MSETWCPSCRAGSCGVHLKSTDKTHGKPGHLCSSLCGAAMIRQRYEAANIHEPGCPARYPETGGDCDCQLHERVHMELEEFDPECAECERQAERSAEKWTRNMAGY